MTPIPNYTEPRTRIRQLFDATAIASVARMNALVIGPNYSVTPYSETAPVGTGVPYASAGQTIPLPAFESDFVLDAASVRVFGQNLDLALTSGSGTIPSLSAANVLKLSSGTVSSNGLHIGDTVAVTTSGGPTLRRKIAGFIGSDVAASFNQAVDAGNNPSAQVSLSVVGSPVNSNFTVGHTGTFSGLAKGAVYGGKYGDLFTISVVTPGAPGTAVLKIRSASGLYDADNVPTTGGSGVYDIDASYFDGVAITLTEAGGSPRGLETTDVISFQIKAPYVPVSGVAGLLAVTGAYTGPSDTTYLLKVVTGGALGAAVLQVTDASGIDILQTRTSANTTVQALGSYGLSYEFNSGAGAWNGGLRKGDVYAIVATAQTQSSVTADKVVLNGPAVNPAGLSAPVSVTWAASVPFTGEINPLQTNASSPTWTVGAGSVVLSANAKVQVSRNSGTAYLSINDNTGHLFPSYRAIVPPAAEEGVLSFVSNPDVDASLGLGGTSNVLAFGVKTSLNAQKAVGATQLVYAVRTMDNTLAAFVEAFNKVRNTDIYYALAILSDDQSVRLAAADAVDAASAEDVKNFRRAYVATETPGDYVKLAKLPNGSNVTATVSAVAGKNVAVYSHDAEFTTLGLVAGDLFRTNYATDEFGTVTFEEYLIAAVVSDQELTLAGGPVSAINPAIKFEIWKAEAPQATADYVAGISSSLGTRRCVNIWTHRGQGVTNTTGTVTVIPNMFLAAEVAGFRSAMVPQQGLTAQGSSLLVAAPAMYLKYSREQLNQIAAAGTWIYTQDVEGGEVYIRHQLTTKTDAGSLQYEDSVGVVTDYVSYLTKDFIAPYKGKRNGNPETLTEMDKGMRLMLDNLMLADPSQVLGPVIVGYRDNGQIVTLDPLFKDHVKIKFQILVALPINDVLVEIETSVAL